MDDPKGHFKIIFCSGISNVNRDDHKGSSLHISFLGSNILAISRYFKFKLTFTPADLNFPSSKPATASTFSSKNSLLSP